MPNAARFSDQTVGVCAAHRSPQGGTISTSAQTVKAGSLGRARATDTVTANCGHTGTLVPGSLTVLVEGLPAARVGDAFVGTYSGTVAMGLPTVLTGG